MRLVGWLRARWPGWRAYWTARGVIPRWQLFLVYVVVVGAGAYGLQSNAATAGKAKDAVARSTATAIEASHAARQAKSAALQANHAVRRVQASRLEQCQEANHRHDGAFRVLNESLRQLPPAERARAELQRKQTVAFIQALAPRRNCRRALK